MCWVVLPEQLQSTMALARLEVSGTLFNLIKRYHSFGVLMILVDNTVQESSPFPTFPAYASFSSSPFPLRTELQGLVAKMSPGEKITGPLKTLTSCCQCSICKQTKPGVSNPTVVINRACSVHHVLDIITMSLAICLTEIEKHGEL